MSPTIRTKFGWNESQALTNNTLISSSAIVGVFFGSLVGGKVVQYGRRRALMIFNIIAALSCALTMVLDLWYICLGRFTFGLSCGVFIIAGPKMVDETIPEKYLGIFGTATNLFLSAGITVAILMGAILPLDDDIQGQLSDQNWRVVYGIPFMCQLISLVMFLTLYREDSIINSINS